MKPHRFGLLVVVACVGSCAPAFRPNHGHRSERWPEASPPDAVESITVTLTPTAAWKDTGVRVHEGERILFAATGEVFWLARNRTTGPDGEKGVPGWSVGPGGLRGRVGVDGKPFDVGARTSTLSPPKHARPPRHPYSLPPIQMPRGGALFLGFKDFVPGANNGMFEVTIRTAAPGP